VDWHEFHDAYDRPGSVLAQRLEAASTVSGCRIPRWFSAWARTASGTNRSRWPRGGACSRSSD